VGDAVVKPGHEGAAAAVVFDEAYLPQWLGEIEGRAHEVADHVLERGLIPRRGQGDAVDVSIKLEVRVCFPVGRREWESWLYYSLAEALKFEQPVLNDRFKPLKIQWLVKG